MDDRVLYTCIPIGTCRFSAHLCFLDEFLVFISCLPYIYNLFRASFYTFSSPPSSKLPFLKLPFLPSTLCSSFITTDVNPYYDAFIRWQFNLLKKKNKLLFGTRNSIYSTVDKQPCADHDRASGEGVVPQEYTLIKIKLAQSQWPQGLADCVAKEYGEDKAHEVEVFLPAATLRPETMYGQTNVFMLPEGDYGIFRINSKEVYVCSDRSAKSTYKRRMGGGGWGMRY